MTTISNSIEVMGERFSLRPTFDIIDYIGSVRGFDVYDANENYLVHYDIDDIEKVAAQISWDYFK